MDVQMICWFYVVLLLNGVRVSSDSSCDSTHSIVSEGNVGDTNTFPWLGVLRVHLHEDTSLKIALTGIVLIKEGYAISNADDIAKIPKHVLIQDSRAMFLPYDQKPWYCQVLDYMTHPEYEFETMSTIALLELDAGPNKYYPMSPICWSSYFYNTSNQLFAVGFTDEHEFLEKSIHKLQYVEKSLCSEFYNRAGLSESKITPTYYQCGFAPNNVKDCVWDNGMALVSNATGYWALIGFGVHGPGCAAPARFIDLIHYYPWIESASNLQEIDEDAYRRKTAFGQDFKKKKAQRIEDIPLHEVFRAGSAARQLGGTDPKLKHDKLHGFSHYYPSTPIIIKRIDKTEIVILNTGMGQAGTCAPSDEVLYKDHIRVRAQPLGYVLGTLPGLPRKGHVKYKLSLFDLYYLNYTCVKIKLHSMRPEAANIYYDTDVYDDRETAASVESQIIQTYPLPSLHTFFPRRSGLDEAVSVPNINVYLRVYFENEGKIEITVFGERSYESHLDKYYPRAITTDEPPDSDTEVIPPLFPFYPQQRPISLTTTEKELEGPRAFLLKSVEVVDEEALNTGTRLGAGTFGIILIVIFLN